MKRKLYQTMLRNESGLALILVMILMVVGSLLITPVLYYLMTGLKAGQVYEEYLEELYAADAGVHQVIPFIKGNKGLPSTGNSTDFTGNLTQTTVNGKTIEVSIYTQHTGYAGGLYKITSLLYI